jgi:hypothetical protein
MFEALTSPTTGWIGGIFLASKKYKEYFQEQRKQ